jgi:hypothetical protein
MFHFLKSQVGALLVGLAAVVGFRGGSVHADSVLLTPVADTSLSEVSSLNNMGLVQSLAAGDTARNERFRALLKFDVGAAIPSGAVVTGASLQLTVVKAPAFTPPSVFVLHRMLMDWGEGEKGAGGLTGLGSLATSGEASWEYRFHPSVPWIDPGGAAGTDYSLTASAIASPVTLEPVNFGSSAEMIADVQGWLDDSDANFGWMVKEEAELIAFTARRLGSREHPTDPPRLQVDYTVPFRIGGIELLDAELCLRFTAREGRTYVVECRTSAESGEWTTVRTLPPAQTTGEVSVCEPLGNGNQFYRVGEQ